MLYRSICNPKEICMVLLRYITLNYLSSSSQTITLLDPPSSSHFARTWGSFVLKQAVINQGSVAFLCKRKQNISSQYWVVWTLPASGWWLMIPFSDVLFSMPFVTLPVQGHSSPNLLISIMYPSGQMKSGWHLGIWNSGHKLYFNCELFYVWHQDTF